MKSYEEMTHDVFQRINEYEVEKKRKKRILAKTTAIVCPVCAAAVVGIGIWQGDLITPPDNQFVENVVVEDTTKNVVVNPVVTSQTNKEIVSATKENAVQFEDNTSAIVENSIINENDTVVIDSTKNDAGIEETPVASVPNDNENNIQPPTIQPATEEVKNQDNDVQVPATSPVIQPATDEPKNQGNDVQASATLPVTQSATDGSNNMWCILVSSLEYNGNIYFDNDTASVTAYTKDAYIGKVSDFKGEYENRANYRINPNDSVYTVKETNDVLFVVKENGAIVVMSNSNWSLDKYEHERLESDYIDSDAQNMVTFNGFCQ